MACLDRQRLSSTEGRVCARPPHGWQISCGTSLLLAIEARADTETAVWEGVQHGVEESIMTEEWPNVLGGTWLLGRTAASVVPAHALGRTVSHSRAWARGRFPPKERLTRRRRCCCLKHRVSTVSESRAVTDFDLQLEQIGDGRSEVDIDVHGRSSQRYREHGVLDGRKWDARLRSDDMMIAANILLNSTYVISRVHSHV